MIISSPTRSSSLGGTLAALVLACAVCSTALAPASAVAATPPSADPFYGVPQDIASYAPGTVLRSRPVTLNSPELASSAAYQLLYRTNDAKEQPTATVATLLLPSAPAPGPRRLVAFATAEDSQTLECSPSYTLRTGVATGTIAAEAQMIDLELQKGWDVVVPDYEGPRSEYGAGPLAGHATLDSIRAAERFAEAKLQGTSTSVGTTGYSGGAIATSWANALQPRYAPELNIVGATAGGLTPDFAQVMAAIDGAAFFGVIIDVNTALTRAYPEFGFVDLLNAKGRALAARDASDADGCSGGVANAPFGHISEYSNYPSIQAVLELPQVKSVFDRLNLISGPVPTAPTYFFHNVDDQIPIKPVDQLVAAYCSQGATVDYVRGQLGEHLVGANVYIAGALQYLEERFAGKPPTNTCPRGGLAPGASATPAPVVPSRPIAARACGTARAFRSASIKPSGAGLRFSFRRSGTAPVKVDVFQVSKGRRVLHEQLIARFSSRHAFRWNGRRRGAQREPTDGYYFVRMKVEVPGGHTAYRRMALRRNGGRWTRQPSFFGVERCGLLRQFKLTRPVFGGSNRTQLGASYLITRRAPVTVTVMRGKKVVARFHAGHPSADRIHHVALVDRGLPRGRYRVRIVAGQGRSAKRTTLYSRRI